MSDMNLTFREVTSENWGDLAQLFEARGGPHYCWCMAWRTKPPKARRSDAKSRKAVLKNALQARAGAETLEAYPVDPDSPSYRFMGRVPQFEKAGFEHAGKTGTRRHVMRLGLG